MDRASVSACAPSTAKHQMDGRGRQSRVDVSEFIALSRDAFAVRVDAGDDRRAVIEVRTL
jgi:hypothetical protein